MCSVKHTEWLLQLFLHFEIYNTYQGEQLPRSSEQKLISCKKLRFWASEKLPHALEGVTPLVTSISFSEIREGK